MNCAPSTIAHERRNCATVGVAGCTGDTNADGSNSDGGETDAGEDLSLEEFEFPEHASKTAFSGVDFFATHFEHLRGERSVAISVSRESVYRGTPTETTIESKIGSGEILTAQNEVGITTDEWSEIGAERGLIRRDTGSKRGYQITADTRKMKEVLVERNANQFAEGFDFTDAPAPAEIDGTLTARYDVSGIADSQPITEMVYADEITEATGSVFVTEDGYVKRFEYQIAFTAKA